MRSPMWLGLPGRDLGEPSSLSQAPPQQREASLVKDASADLKASLITILSSPESISGDEDDSKEEMYDSLTSHTAASDSTSADLLTSTASAVEDISSKPPSVIESKFSPILPYLEESSQPGQAQDDSVFTEHSSQHLSNSSPHVILPSSPSESPAPGRSARSTKEAPPVQFGKVYTYSTIVSKVAETPKFRQTLFVTCTPNG